MLEQLTNYPLYQALLFNVSFQGLEFINVALIIFSLIFVCLSYVLFKLFKATHSNNQKHQLQDHDDVVD